MTASIIETDRKPLLPIRHAEPDLFVCDVLDAIPKDDVASMEHPVFSLATKPDKRVRRYEHNGTIIEIVPSGLGLATIHDKDVLIYCISQLMAKINRGEEPSRTVRLQAYDLLVATNRDASGDGYRRLKEALTRLRGTTIVTNLKTGTEETTHGFGIIDEFKIVKNSFDGRMQELELTLSEWVYRSVISKSVLTLHRDYFRLRKPVERRMYELARKHCGQQEEWSISLAVLQKKCGSTSPERAFRSFVKVICAQDAEHNHFPDYSVQMTDDMVRFQKRKLAKLKADPDETYDRPYVDPEGMHDAKSVAPGYDIYGLYEEWVSWWLDMEKPPLKNPNAAFIGFCRKKAQRNPLR